MKFKDYVLINERVVDVYGKSFKSEKEAGFYLGSIGKSAEEIVNLLGTTLPMAKWYARAGAKAAGGIPPVSKKKTDENPVTSTKRFEPTPIVKGNSLSSNSVNIKGRNGEILIPIKMKAAVSEYDSSDEVKAKYSMWTGGFEYYDISRTAAVAVIDGKFIYKPEDVPSFSHDSIFEPHNVANIIAKNFPNEVSESLEHLNQDFLSVFQNSSVYNKSKVSIAKKNEKGGWCRPAHYQIMWGSKSNNAFYSLQVLRHELMHQLEGINHTITVKISQKVLDSDMDRLKKPSAKIDTYVDDIINNVDPNLYKIEADKILQVYDLSFEDLLEIVRFDRNNTVHSIDDKQVLKFALHLSQGDITTAFKSLYTTEVMNYDGELREVFMKISNQPVYNPLSDFIGTITKNKILGAKLGEYGHPTSYYNKLAGTKAANCELIACYGALMGYNISPLIKKLVKAFAPHTVNAIDAIIKTQAYLNSKGDKNDYI